jgi:hypothetical protein
MRRQVPRWLAITSLLVLIAALGVTQEILRKARGDPPLECCGSPQR